MNVIYTAIFGDYDDLKEPLIITPGWRYACYTDQLFESKIWDIVNCGSLYSTNNPIKAARDFKINAGIRNDANKTIWVDGSFTINCNLNKFWDKNFVSPMTVVKHPMRDCIYDEGEICIKNNRGNHTDIARQCLKYRAEGMPRSFGLIQSGIILRENLKEVREFCNLWWQQIALSTRDQIGFSYAEWKLGVKWPSIENFDYRNNRDFIFTTHKNRRRGKNSNINIQK